MLKGGLSYRAKASIALSLALLTLTVTVLFYSYVHHELNFARHPRIIHTRHESIDTRSHAGIYSSGMLSNLRKLSMNALSFFSAPTAQITRAHSKPEDVNAKKTFYFHFDHTLTSHDESIEQLEKLGVKLGRFIPQNTYLVTASPKQAQEAKDNVKGLIWIGEMMEHHKMPKDAELRGHIDRHLAVSELREFESARMCHADTKDVLAGRKQLETKGAEFLIHAHVAKHASKKELQQEIEAWEDEIRRAFPSIEFASLVVASKEKFALGVVGKEEAIDVMNWLSKKPLVHWVELKPPVITHNKYASMVTQSNSNPHSKPIWSMGISGQGQVIGVGDTGCDHYHCFFYDEHNPVPFQRNMRQDVADSKHRKFAGYWEFMDKLDSEGGHGSHVSGTASGNALSYANPIVRDYSSLAKDSKLAFLDAGCDTEAGCSCPQDTQCECDLKANRLCSRKFGVVYLPLDLSEGYFPYFYSKNAKVASNSWGTGYYKDFSFGYSTSTSEIDQFVWDHKDFLPVFAAGNSGGQYGYASLTSESEAKNALVVGASQSSLESFQALANFTDYSRIIERIRSELYQAYCLDAPTSPLCEKAKAFVSMEQCCNDGGKCGGEVSTKCCGNQDFDQFPTLGFRCCDKCISFEMAHQAEHFSTNNLALFTARGPTMDGRIKPDIVTVGDKILSTKSLGTREDRKCNANQGEADILLKHEGTSMAAPNAAAAAVLVRQFFEDGYYPSGKANPSASVKPSASLVKGMLIHSAQLLTGYIYLMSKHVWWPLQYKPGHRFALRQAYMQGFGRIELEQVMGMNSGLIIPNLVDKSLSTGEMHSYCYYIKSSQKPFRVTLVWSDYPSTPVAKINLVNDLDLIIVGPDNKIFYGNGPKSVIESSRDEPDYLNNVEQILMTDVPPGHYNIIVRGTAVPKGPQTYTILISGDMEQAKSCNSIPAAVTAEVQKYMSLSVAMGVISVVFIPGFALLALYFYIQYRRVTTGGRGYRESVMSKKGQGEYFGLDEESADNVKPSAGVQPQPEFQMQN